VKSCFTSLVVIVFFLTTLSACAPTRYPPGYQGDQHVKASLPASTMLGKGGYVKRGKPYQIYDKWYHPLASGDRYDETGIASWYGKKFHGKKTANGETYDMYAMTAAHTTLPMPSMVLVTNLDNGKQIEVRVNDRGPFVKNRLIDLSYTAAKALGYLEKGTARVRVQTLGGSYAKALQESISPRATLAPSVAIKKAYIQLGAFSVKESAYRFSTQLKIEFEQGLPEPKVYPTVGVYRVRMGPFSSDSAANSALQQVKSGGYDAMIVHD